jgi:hypothetical protein
MERDFKVLMKSKVRVSSKSITVYVIPYLVRPRRLHRCRALDDQGFYGRMFALAESTTLPCSRNGASLSRLAIIAHGGFRRATLP